MKISIIIDENNNHLRRIKSAISLINSCQNYFFLNYQLNDKVKKTGAPINPESISNSFTIEADEYVILISEDLFDDDWFSHEYRNKGIVTIGDWETHYAPPSLKSYIIYQFAQTLLQFAADISEEMALNLVHEPPVGCIFDFSLHKEAIKIGMVAGNLCPDCITKLKTLGTDDKVIESILQIVHLVRNEAIGRPEILAPDETFVVMRFSKNDENDNAWKYGIKKGIEGCGLKAIRADDYVQSGQILEKIENHIKRSRLIVCKVDEDNLNVYFELGLARGLSKDVLLISNQDLVLQLPSDLKNWECLTYEKGNYEQLENNIKKYLRDTYHLTINLD